LRLSSTGGISESLVKRGAAAGYLFDPQILPDGKSLLYTMTKNNFSEQRVMVKSLESGESKEVISGWHLGYAPTGHIVYWPGSSSNLFAIPFDLKKLAVSGGPFALVENVDEAAVSQSGTLVYTSVAQAQAQPAQTLVWVDRKGNEEPITAPPNNYGQPKISPDGTRLAVAVGPSKWKIFISGTSFVKPSPS